MKQPWWKKNQKKQTKFERQTKKSINQLQINLVCNIILVAYPLGKLIFIYTVFQFIDTIKSLSFLGPFWASSFLRQRKIINRKVLVLSVMKMNAVPSHFGCEWVLKTSAGLKSFYFFEQKHSQMSLLWKVLISRLSVCSKYCWTCNF